MSDNVVVVDVVSSTFRFVICCCRRRLRVWCRFVLCGSTVTVLAWPSSVSVFIVCWFALPCRCRFASFVTSHLCKMRALAIFAVRVYMFPVFETAIPCCTGLTWFLLVVVDWLESPLWLSPLVFLFAISLSSHRALRLLLRSLSLAPPLFSS